MNKEYINLLDFNKGKGMISLETHRKKIEEFWVLWDKINAERVEGLKQDIKETKKKTYDSAVMSGINKIEPLIDKWFKIENSKEKKGGEQNK